MLLEDLKPRTMVINSNPNANSLKEIKWTFLGIHTCEVRILTLIVV